MFASGKRSQGPQYDMLPTAERGSGGGVSYGPTRWLNFKRRRNLVGFATLVTTVVLTVYLLVSYRDSTGIFENSEPVKEEQQPLPPLYPEWHKEELALPQHDRNLDPFAGGRKYLWVANHVQMSGFGNFMQDMIFNAELTYRLKRSYVFDNFTWDRDGPEYSQFNGNTIPSRIPLSALISGPIVGGPFNEGDPVPKAVVKEYFDEICPTPTVIRADEIRKLHGEGATAEHIIETYIDYINKIDDPCLEMERHSGSIFHIFMFGTPREILPSWPKLSQSPVLKLFGWGSPAHTAFETNRHLFAPEPLIQEYVATHSCPHCVDPYAKIPGLLAIHLRRGDFLEHCVNLAHWGAGFNAFNTFPSFPDPWAFPEGTDEEKVAVYVKRCVPDIKQIVAKIEEVRRAPGSEGLKNIYIMTNGDREWLKELKVALARAHRWEHIATSRDMVLTPEQKYVSQTMDMLIGERAQVLIGNGFSSMTSNIAMLRMARGQLPITTHML